MPKISKLFELDVTPEKFLDNCSDLELMEVACLILSPRFQKRLDNMDGEIFEYEPVGEHFLKLK